MIDTERLVLRGRRDEDAEEFVRVTNTPAVMEHLGGVDDPATLATSAAAQQKMQAKRRHCLWIVERTSDSVLLGYCGLKVAGLAGTPVANDIEIGWRLREDAWHQGYASEAAAASLACAWANLDAPRIVAFTIPANRPSWRLMERLGTARRLDLDFAHPRFPLDHPLSSHITYVMERPA